MRDLTLSTDHGLLFGPTDRTVPVRDDRVTGARGLPPPTWDPERCAVGRHGERGCRRCVDACPYEAIKVLARPEGSVVHIAADACARCGTCTGVCPTSALQRAFATDAEIDERVRAGLAAAPGAPVVFTCSASAARLPEGALVVTLPSVTVLNETHVVRAARHGAREVVVLGCEACHHGAAFTLLAALETAAQLAPAARFRYVEDTGRALELDVSPAPEPGSQSRAPAPLAGGRPEVLEHLLRDALGELAPETVVGDSGPFATVTVDDGACTLCGACARACPVHALSYDAAAGSLDFRAVDCVRCGLCVGACHEGALSLTPGIAAADASLEPVTLVRDDVVACRACGQPYLPARLLTRVREVVERTSRHLARATEDVGLCPGCRAVDLDPAPTAQANGAAAGPPPSSPNRPARADPPPRQPPTDNARRSFLRTAAASVAAAAGLMFTQRAQAQLRARPVQRTKRLGMVIDLERCVGCHACTAICKAENDVPLGVYRDWVEEHELGTYPYARAYFLPKLCNHCDDPGCLRACPTGAIFMRTDGIIDLDHDLCIACRACNQGCPYGSTFMHPVRATADKCNLCAHRVDQGLNPACVDICPSRCRIFGDLDDPDSAPSIALRGQTHQVLRRELGLGPNVRYLGLPAELDR
jgi:tetrathionate reductase subunit B